jgi:hypothetical protein
LSQEHNGQAEADAYRRLETLEELRVALNRHADGYEYGPATKLSVIVIFPLIVLALLALLALFVYTVKVWMPGEAWVWIGGLIALCLISPGLIKLGIRLLKVAERSGGSWDEYIALRLHGYQPLTPEQYRQVLNASREGTADASLLLRWLVEYEIPAAEKDLQDKLPRRLVQLQR